MTRSVLPVIISLLAVALSAPVFAFPDKPLRLIVPFPPGGGTDLTVGVKPE